MAVPDWPASLVPARATWGLQSNTETFTSPLNRSIQTTERPGARWKVTLELPSMTADKRGRLEAFLASLGGMAGRFRLWPHARPVSAVGVGASDAGLVLDFLNQAYQAQGTPAVSGALSDFRVLPSKFWPASTLVLRAGEYLEVGGELKIVTADVVSDASGGAAIPIAPPFRMAPQVNAELVLDRPRATMMLINDEYSVSVGQARISETVVIAAVEAWV
ncbi:hypothetical protein [Cupriavidus basilensis]|uniref:hypothetical protein n=1 Tax=Cupriavidus basilensis TaxID=68895 RepID=UPI002848C007|nr:hypothetical protein [Cupriavidus basilensis]MDR3381732.1 hypothetical protein [Cupriavidus basilensis]